MGRTPLSRRQARSWRITVAIALLGAASLVLAGALARGDQLLIGVAGVLALVTGWVALRLAWLGIVRSRFEHSVDRTELAAAYRDLFARRSVEHAGFVSSMAERLALRDRTIDHLSASVEVVEMRAVEAQSSAETFALRLTDAARRITAMEGLVERNLREQEARHEKEQQAAQQQAAAARVTELPVPARAVDHRGKPPLLGRRADPLRQAVVPEWADLETDPVTALMAWEEYADALSHSTAGRHAAPEEPRAGNG